MRINTIQADNKNINNYRVSHKGGREILSTISNPDSLTATIVLESFVTGGRGIRAYKRGGFPEFRERFTDDVVSAVFWMKGVDIFNKLGNKFGEKVLKLPETEFDVGKDALRTPFANVVKKHTANFNNEQAVKALEKKLAVFKFTKIILSSLLATGFVGFVLPKINQAVTEKLMSKNKSKKNNKNSDKIDLLQNYSLEQFDKKISLDKNQSFKGLSPQKMTTAAHYLENNKICKMLTCDVGILTGRVITARNPDEGLEYFFRDTASCFFYFASTPLIYKLLQTVTKSSKITNIDPVAARRLNKILTEQLQNADGSFKSMRVNEFTAKTIGVLDDKAKELISKLPFKSDVIPLKELGTYITNENLMKKAEAMASLQPEQAVLGKVLTKQQVQDVFKNGSVNNPEFMQKIYEEKFGAALTDSKKFIPMKKITKFRDNMDDYVKAITETAKKKNGGIVDKKLLDSINKKSFIMSAGFRTAAIGVSALALGYVIPKLQYKMTEKRTGSTAAPGLRKYQEQDNNKQTKSKQT